MAKKTEGKCGARAIVINAYTYLTWVLSYSRMDLSDKDYVFKGIKWINVNGTRTISGDFTKLYDIHGTPQLFLLDKDKHIIAKQFSVGQLKMILIDNAKRHSAK